MKVQDPSSLAVFAVPVAAWFITNALSTHYSKAVLYGGSSYELKQMLCLAAWVTFAQLLVSGVSGALYVGIKNNFSKGHLFSYLLKAKEVKDPAYNMLMITGAFNAIGSLCVNIAYIHGSISLVQIIKTLEPVTTYFLSAGLLGMRHDPQMLASICLVVAGAAYTSWKDSSHNVLSIVVAIISNFMMPLRNVLMTLAKKTHDDTKTKNQPTTNTNTNEKPKTTEADLDNHEEPPTGFVAFGLISAIGSVFVGLLSLLATILVASPPPATSDVFWKTFLSSAFYMGYNGSSFVVLNLTDTVTHSILNICKRFFNILANIAMFNGKEFTRELAVGLFLSFLGLLMFNLARQQKKNQESKNQESSAMPSLRTSSRANATYPLWAVVAVTSFFSFWQSSQMTSNFNTKSLARELGKIPQRTCHKCNISFIENDRYICHWLAYGANFGDEIGPAVSEALLKRHFGCSDSSFDIKPLVNNLAAEDRKGSCLMTLGSIHQHTQKGDHVWGTGINPFHQKQFAPNITYYGVRGTHTLKVLHDKRILASNVTLPLGDPATALKLLYPELFELKSDGIRCFVPHAHDAVRFQKDFKERELTDRDLRLVSVADTWQNVTQKLAKCESIASSSLHGLVLADTLGIPSRWFQYKDTRTQRSEGFFKYQDYFTSIERENATSLSDLSEVFIPSKYWDPPPSATIEAVANELLHSFPYHLFQCN